MRRPTSGYSLLEFVLVLALASGLLLATVQYRQVSHQTRLTEFAATDFLEVRARVYDYFAREGQFPTQPSEMHGELVLTPWGTEFSFTPEANSLRVSAAFPNTAIARRVADRLPWAILNDRWVHLDISPPIQSAATDHLLHRFMVSGQPELNRMETHLDMGGHDLLNVGQLNLEMLVAEQVTAEHVYTDRLTADFANVYRADIYDLFVSYLDAGEVVTDHLEAMLLEVISASVGHLSTGVLEAEQVLVSGLLEANRIDAQDGVFANLTAETVTAVDFITPAGSVNELWDRMYALEGLWSICIASGGCR
ncbi:MAG: shufflon system plasmid conjugative transfer pilus tip adhesin PilV [Idiomarina sp.]|nr:shufflon system plasmid conjugative transfer pilus tip adhesin PilV [Idiomarina sp.]